MTMERVCEMSTDDEKDSVSLKTKGLNVIYRKLRDSIVAFVQKYHPLYDDKPKLPKFPRILGTGFVVREDGVIATNAHIVKLFNRVYKPQNVPKEDWPVYAILFKIIAEGMLEVPLNVLGVYKLSFTPDKVYYGPKEGPDLAFVQLNVKGLSTVNIDSSTLVEEGTEVATAGFPMGTDMLTAPGWLHQITPTLQRGIISAVHPYAAGTPHSYSVNIMVQGGASGSPVFECKTGKVIGMVSGAIYDRLPLVKNFSYRVPTNIGYVVPSHYIAHFLDQLSRDGSLRLPTDAETLAQMLENRKKVSALKEEEDKWIIRRADSDLGEKGIQRIIEMKTK